MKFEFRLKGQDWFWIYFIGIALYAIQMVVNQNLATPNGAKLGTMDPSSAFLGFFVMVGVNVAMLFLYVPYFRKFFRNTHLAGSSFQYTGTIFGFVFRYIGYGFLSIVTLGIYIPWAIQKMFCHVAGNTEYNGKRLRFEGKAYRLFLFGIPSLILPIILVCTLFATTINSQGATTWLKFPVFALFYVLLIPFLYFMLQWISNVRYENYQLKLESQAIPSVLKILQEVVLSIITLGIYAPAAHARLFRYFAERTSLQRDDGSSYSLRTDLDVVEAWKFTWIQCLLTIVTVGLYGAWGYSKIMALYVNSASLERS